jgi:hypothetical protein
MRGLDQGARYMDLHACLIVSILDTAYILVHSETQLYFLLFSSVVRKIEMYVNIYGLVWCHIAISMIGSDARISPGRIQTSFY